MGTTIYGPGVSVDARNYFGQAIAVAPGATVDVTVVIAVSDLKVRGFSATGEGDGYFALQVEGATILSGRIHMGRKSIVVSNFVGDMVEDSVTVSLKVTNESLLTSNFEGTILAE